VGNMKHRTDRLQWEIGVSILFLYSVFKSKQMGTKPEGCGFESR
jgi:hypothetical protein